MKIRQLNEKTGDIQWSHVKNVFISGQKNVFEIKAGAFQIAGSENHLILTDDGWKQINELRIGDGIVVRKFGKKTEDKVDSLRLRKIDGKWRSTWQNKQRKIILKESTLCRNCFINEGRDIHHIEPVNSNPEKAFDTNNITFLCIECHNAMHVKQTWQGGTYLYGSIAIIEEINFRGVEETYDLEIEGEFPNFLANGIVVHNSRNAASTRAIPTQKFIERIKEDPFIPEFIGKNQPGMVAGEELTGLDRNEVLYWWKEQKRLTLIAAQHMADAGVHKQIVNRILEPYMWVTIIISGTEWDNFFGLRCHADTEPHMNKIACMMRDARDNSTPVLLKPGQWHLPLIFDEDRSECSDIEILKKISVGRCARVSFLTHSGKRDHEKDIELHDRLMVQQPLHASPGEHVAVALGTPDRVGNFIGWKQYRKFQPNENIGRIMP